MWYTIDSTNLCVIQDVKNLNFWICWFLQNILYWPPGASLFSPNKTTHRQLTRSPTSRGEVPGVWMTRTLKKWLTFIIFHCSERPPTQFIRAPPYDFLRTFFSRQNKIIYGVKSVLAFSKLIIGQVFSTRSYMYLQRYTQMCPAGADGVKLLHMNFNVDKKGPNYWYCSIYAGVEKKLAICKLALRKIFGPKIWSCKFFDKFHFSHQDGWKDHW